MLRSQDGTPQQLTFTWTAAAADEIGSAGKRSKISHITTHALNSWDIDGGLAADFDGSLSGLGTEMGTSSYNMSEALLALPVFKQENLENGFQYILGAATSPAVKMNEETLTYLNQGQSYEIKLKKLGDLSDLQGKFLQTQIKILFHERRLQYMEKEQIEAWKRNRPGDRILDIDIPLSYGLIDVNLDSVRLNQAEFIWDPTKETGVYIRVHCISTEFTAKKHGGEKGVPFRIQVETYTNMSTDSKLIHCASCQVKVFKPKGADRKHKTDREKMDKRSEAEKEKYQPSYECTVLTEVPLDQVLAAQAALVLKSPTSSISSISPMAANSLSETSCCRSPPSTVSPPSPPQSTSTPVVVRTPTSPVITGKRQPEPEPLAGPMAADTTASEVTQWLIFNRFSNYTRVFQNFSGADLLRLNREDLIQICGLADGIRLNNCLQSRAVRPRLTIYVCQELESVYHALYLDQMTVPEMSQRLALLFGMPVSQIGDIYIQGPSGIHVLVTDEVVANITDQTRFSVEGMKDDSSPKYRVLLRNME